MSYLKDMFKIETEGYKSLYELYYELYLSKKSELDNTIKIFNKKKDFKITK